MYPVLIALSCFMCDTHYVQSVIFYTEGIHLVFSKCGGNSNKSLAHERGDNAVLLSGVTTRHAFRISRSRPGRRGTIALTALSLSFSVHVVCVPELEGDDGLDAEGGLAGELDRAAALLVQHVVQLL